MKNQPVCLEKKMKNNFMENERDKQKQERMKKKETERMNEYRNE